MKTHYLQPGVGHYGVFNGSRFRSEIAPRIADFVLSHNGAQGRQARRGGTAPVIPAEAARCHRPSEAWRLEARSPLARPGAAAIYAAIRWTPPMSLRALLFRRAARSAD